MEQMHTAASLDSKAADSFVTESPLPPAMAGFWRRLFAIIIDATILGLLGIGLGFLFWNYFIEMGVWGRLLGFLIAGTYFSILNSEISGGQTVGKRISGIKVVDKDNKTLSFTKSVLRYAVLGIPFFLNSARIPYATTMPVGVIMGLIVFGVGGSIIYLFLFNWHTRRSLHDLTAGSYVVRKSCDSGIGNGGLWKGHWIPMGCWMTATFAFMVYMPMQGRSADIVDLQNHISETSKYRDVRLMLVKRTFNDEKSELLEVNVLLKSMPSDVVNEKFALASKVLQRSPTIFGKDGLSITMCYGYDIGIASMSKRWTSEYKAQQWADLIEARRLSDQVVQLFRQGNSVKAVPLAEKILDMQERVLGPDNLDVAQSLHNLAMLYYAQGQYARAEPLYKRSLAIREKALGPDHPDVAQSLHNLALLCYAQGQYAQAEPLYKRSLAIWEKTLGPDHPKVAMSSSELGRLYHGRGQYTQAEPLYKRSLAIWEKTLGPDHSDVAQSLNTLALLYDAQGHYAQAEPLYKRSLAIWEKTLGPDHPNAGMSLYNLGELYRKSGREKEAEALEKRAAEIEAIRR